jgi:hypothetical protein
MIFVQLLFVRFGSVHALCLLHRLRQRKSFPLVTGFAFRSSFSVHPQG